ncbi:hypothetical protein SEA_NICEHOUSE_275 [Rhodococcus phage NiceHouse]|nr:hypothetical protein SEA_NICEHOUSE_275 [Rhodococcus phage NiceHouse]
MLIVTVPIHDPSWYVTYYRSWGPFETEEQAEDWVELNIPDTVETQISTIRSPDDFSLDTRG